jgi:hypothetical protein
MLATPLTLSTSDYSNATLISYRFHFRMEKLSVPIKNLI